MQGGVDGGVLVEGDLQRRIQVPRQVLVDRPAGRELTRLDANHLAVARNTRAQVGLGEAHLRAGKRKARLGLRHVRASDLADVESIAGLAELLLQNLDVVALQIENCGVPQDVHIRRGAIEKDVLLVVAQRLAGAQNLRLGLADRVLGDEPVEQVLLHLKAVTARHRPRRRARVRRHGVEGIARIEGSIALRFGDDAGDLRRGVEVGAPPGFRLGNLLVRRAHVRALGVQGRVVSVGPRERAFERLGGRSLRKPEHGEGHRPAEEAPACLA